MRWCHIVLLFVVLWNPSQGFLFRKKFKKHPPVNNGANANNPAPSYRVRYVPLDADMKQKFVDAHNLARSDVDPPAADMQMVEWDDEIAEVSRRIAGKCNFAHTLPSERMLPQYPYGLGENIFVGMSKYHSDKPEYMIHKWDEERDFYNYTDLSCLTGKMCGHYTQVVWSTTSKIGCAIAICPGGVKNTRLSIFDLVTFCHYGPPGNWRGTKPYKEGEPCTACPAEKNYCENNMCTAS